jgi:predicted Rossmann fold nucleotide-binding protein DprA/Smf involved in DNA uptake
VASKIADELVEAGITTVSRLACGIDTAARQSTLDAGSHGLSAPTIVAQEGGINYIFN